MFKHRLRAPSPAFVISLIALFLALGGTSYAATKVTFTKHKDAKADTTLVKRLAPSLSVKHAKAADNATNAVNATNTVNATHATSADSATNATNATNATHATNATTAQTANVANAIGAVTYVKGTVRDAPANGCCNEMPGMVIAQIPLAAPEGGPRGAPPRPKTSTMIMVPPQQGHGGR